jgi:hypothetical protein
MLIFRQAHEFQSEVGNLLSDAEYEVNSRSMV